MTQTEPCPTCMQPVPVPQRGDHDYGLPLSVAAHEERGLDVERLARAIARWSTFAPIGSTPTAVWLAAEYARLEEKA